MLGSLGAFCLPVGVLLVFVGGCSRQATVTTASSTPLPVSTPAPTTRAAGEFVRIPRRTVLGGAEVRLPIELVTNTPVIEFTSDGVRRRMTLDTGSDSVIVTPSFAAAAHLTTLPSNRTYRDASGIASGNTVAMVDRLELGSARFKDFDAGVAELSVGSDALLGWPRRMGLALQACLDSTGFWA